MLCFECWPSTNASALWPPTKLPARQAMPAAPVTPAAMEVPAIPPIAVAAAAITAGAHPKIQL